MLWYDEIGSKKNINDKFKDMQLTSSNFNHHGKIPKKYTCDGENVNPALNIEQVPEGTKSLALVVDDPDAPAGDWVHWLVWNISPEIKKIEENSVPPSSLEGTTDFGAAKWGGPCPPSGEHRYFFKVYALDDYLDLDASAVKADVLKAMEGHILEKTELVGLYQRQ